VAQHSSPVSLQYIVVRSPSRAMSFPLFALTVSLNLWAASGCSTANADLLTTGPGVVTGNNCPTTMQDGETCKATCNSNATAIGTMKCLHGSLQDVSMCIPTELLHKFAAVPVDKVLGAWDVGLSKEPTAAQMTEAAVAGFMMPSHFIETAWIASKSAGAAAEEHIYKVKYWVIVKPGMHPDIVKAKANGFPLSNTTHHQLFRASLESKGVDVTSIVEASPPTAVKSMAMKNQLGQNINPFDAPAEAWL